MVTAVQSLANIVASFLPKYEISIQNEQPVEIVKNLKLFKHEYTINDWDIKIKGDFIAHNYSVERGGTVIAAMTKEFLSWGDTYSINVNNQADELIALSAILVVDCCMEAAQND